jgi:phosphohistidine phosphatase SixA
VQHVVLVGHNPGMEGLASGLCGATPEDVFVRMPTAALAHVAVDASHWSMVRWGAGQLQAAADAQSVALTRLGYMGYSGDMGRG